MQTKTTLIKIIVFVLIVCAVLSCFAGCRDDEKTESGIESETVSSTEVSSEPNLRYDKKGFLMDDLPDNLNYMTTTVSVLCWNAENTEFYVKEYGGSAIDSAVYTRNSTVEQRLKVKLKFEQINGSVAYVGEYKTTVQNAYSSGNYWDIIASYTRSTAVCATAGLLTNLGNMDDSYLDFSKPWWSKDVIDKTVVGDSFYFCTGDISTNLVQMIYCVWFNADELEDIGQESPYALVEKNEWTLNKMIEMTKNYYHDANDDKVVNNGDKLSIAAEYWDYPALLHGAGVPITVRDASGSFVMNPEFKGQKTINIIETVTDWVHTGGGMVGNYGNSFQNGDLLFLISQSGTALKYFSNVTFEYGCVPVPKYNSEQENYYSTVRQPITLYGIMVNAPENRLEMVSATMECMASEGYRQTTPVIFDANMKYTHSTSGNMAKMMQLIKDTAFFDCSRIHSAEVSVVCDMPGESIRDRVPWTQYVNGIIPAVEKKLQNLSIQLLGMS